MLLTGIQDNLLELKEISLNKFVNLIFIYLLVKLTHESFIWQQSPFFTQ